MTTKKLVGAHVEPEDASYLALYATASQTSKSHIVRDQIRRWASFRRTNHPVEKLITTISDNIQKEWDATRNKYIYTDKYYIDDSPFEYFKRMISLRLKSKGVNPRYINRILERLQDEADKTVNTPE